ncbi:MAG: UDP-3-O-(3-hydroxymyristoyl)glucosamine N-acyltransferase [Candidatus Omnitrophica bacterium]|nr:UDP-3-O-(3-hydroxymyristoyl)glucosamine N-acyltransferase [Candidatus Omnitrophota bacterium]
MVLKKGRKAGATRAVSARRLKELARLVSGEVVGDGNTLITGICGIKEARAGDITFIANSKYQHLLQTTQASAVITSRDVQTAPKPIIRTDNPSLAFSKLVSHFVPSVQKHPSGVSPRAFIGKGVRVGKGAAVGPFAVVEEGASIGDRTVVYAGAYIGRDASVGNDCLIYPHVTIRERVEIGHRVIVHSGSVIGSDGFGFATVQGVHHKIPQIGTVIVEDDVEIGANVTIDRARFGKTLIGRGTKIDNLVQIAHNVIVGPNSILVSQSGISGSTVLGSNVVLAGQAGLVGHITIGDNVMVGGQSGVTKSVPPNTHVWGIPAKPLAKAKRINAVVQRLPELHKTVEMLEQRIEELERERGRKSVPP